MPLDISGIKDDNYYTVVEIAEMLGRSEWWTRMAVNTRLPDEYRIDQNPKGKFRKYLVSWVGVKFLLGIIK